MDMMIDALKDIQMSIVKAIELHTAQSFTETQARKY
jgi:hypothetical protein